MHIRSMQGGSEMARCTQMIFDEWGSDAADRFREQAYEYLRNSSPYAPRFIVATLDGNSGLLGVAAYHRTMRMNGDYDLIWIKVHPDFQGKGVGKALTAARLDLIRKAQGSTANCVTQKPEFFEPFGFQKVAEYGNGWVLMLNKLKDAEI